MLTVHENTRAVLTSEAPPPHVSSTPGELASRTFHRNMCHKRLGCMLTASGSVNQSGDARHRLQQAQKANKRVFAKQECLQQPSLTPLSRGEASCGGSHRSIRRCGLRNLNVEWRKMFKCGVGPRQEFLGTALLHL